MLKTEEDIRKLYRSYIEIFASDTGKINKAVLYGALLAYGRVLGFNEKKVQRDLEKAKNKYFT